MTERLLPSNIYGIPPGLNFVTAFVDGYQSITDNLTPYERANATIFVNTSRMQRQLRDALIVGRSDLLPRIRLVTDLATDLSLVAGHPSPSPLREKLKLSQLISKLLENEPDLAPRSSLFPLTDSLADLLNEMTEEEVGFEDLLNLKIEDQSGHWHRTLKFLEIIGPISQQLVTSEAIQKTAVHTLIKQWRKQPPNAPVFVIGSTGSRKTTRTLMKAVCQLDNGYVVLPGFDQEMPDAVWTALGGSDPAKPDFQEDHPQFRFWKFLHELGLSNRAVKSWPGADLADSGRNALVSLALRPAPITEAWLDEGPKLPNLHAATDGVSLLEAPSQKVEATAIALLMRQALDDKKSVALVSPDRVLTRQVASALDRWNIVPDDSAGVPLQLTAPGRLMCHVLEIFQGNLTVESLLVLLKHPLSHTGRDDRGDHLLRTRELELALREKGTVLLDLQLISEWAEERQARDPGAAIWGDWICKLLSMNAPDRTLATWIKHHVSASERLSAGPRLEGSGELWEQAAGRAVSKTCADLELVADAAGELSAFDYGRLFRNVLSKDSVPDHNESRTDLSILGTLESRALDADIVILGGLNEGVWPSEPSTDPWLNRSMRSDAGLLSPERLIGLSAHDFQQAVACSNVVISRSLRDAESETVASRWVNRITNLLGGLAEKEGPTVLENMRGRGKIWIKAAQNELVAQNKISPAKRPSPRPPVQQRPKQLSVTRIKTLIRDPYSIYAEKILRLEKLNPINLRQEASLRGIVYHRILQLFFEKGLDANAATAVDDLIELAHTEIAKACPWPSICLQWQTRFEMIAPRFIEDEKLRSQSGAFLASEVRGERQLENPEFLLVGIADRIDQTTYGGAIIYDYKTGKVPTQKEQLFFDKQLLLEAAMLEAGGFEKTAAMPVSDATFLGITTKMEKVSAPLGKIAPSQVWDEFRKLIENWNNPNRGYTARLALHKKSDFGAYDHLSRFGEWNTSDDVVAEDLE